MKAFVYLWILCFAFTIAEAQFSKPVFPFQNKEVAVNPPVGKGMVTYVQFSKSINGPFSSPATILTTDSLFIKMDVTPLDSVLASYWLDVNQNGTVDPLDFFFSSDIYVDNGTGPSNMVDLDATEGVIIGYLAPENPPSMQVVVKAAEGNTTAEGILIFQNPPASFTLSGTVYNMQNETLPGINIWVVHEEIVSGTVSGANGQYSIPLDSGTYYIRVEDWGGRFSPIETTMVITENTIKDFYLSEPTSYIRGYVRSELGHPIANIGVRLQNGGWGTTVRTDLNGHYQLMVSAGYGRIGLSTSDLLPTYMLPSIHEFTIGHNDSIVDNEISNFVCYTTNASITGTVTQNGGIPDRFYSIGGWTQLYSSYTETITNSSGQYTLPVRDDKNMPTYIVWLRSESSEYPLPRGMYVDTSYGFLQPGATADFNIIPAETTAVDSFPGHYVPPSWLLWETYSYNQPWGPNTILQCINNRLALQSHSQSGKSGIGVTSRKPYSLDNREFRVTMDRSQMGVQNSAFILLTDEKKQWASPNYFYNCVMLWSGNNSDPGWKLAQLKRGVFTTLWDLNDTAGTNIVLQFSTAGTLTLTIDGATKYQGSWGQHFSMAYVYLAEENNYGDNVTPVFFDNFSVGAIGPTSVREISGVIPREFSLEQNYPNPFNPSTTIRFELPKESFVTLKVFNVLGQEIATLVNEKKQAGIYEVQYSPEGSSASGVYFYRLTAGEFVKVKKLLLLK